MYLTFTLFTDILFIKSSMKTLLIFLKAPYNGHKMREESMCNMWSCVFPFHNVQNYHGNLGFLSWNIIEKPLKFFEACLWEPWDNIFDLENERWLLGDMIDHVGIYGSRVAEGLSAFNVGLVFFCHHSYCHLVRNYSQRTSKNYC